MSLLQMYVCILIMGSIISSAIISKKWESKLLHSHKMMISMYSGNSIGLLIGVVLTMVISEDFFTLTILGMVIGASCAMLFCWNLGITYILGGLMSGLMGGMMGAMVGSMVHVSQLYTLTNIFVLLLVSSIILYPIFADSDRLISKAWILKPIIVLLIISAILIGGSSLIHEPVFLHNDELKH